jgi:hypothetical protein
MFPRQAGFVFRLLCFAALPVAHGANSVLTITSATDTMIMSTDGANPRGDQTILVGTRGTQAQGILDRGLLRFDLSELPTNAIIQSATVKLVVVQSPQNPIPSIFNLHRLLTSWNETANWENSKTGLPWSVPGAKEGVDYSADISAGQEVDENDEYEFGPTDQLKADIQSWILNPSSNNGWLLISDNEGMFFTARHFGSSESTDPPQLVLEFSVGTTAGPLLKDPEAKNNILTFTFAPTAGHGYAVEARTNLILGNWTVVTNIPASTGTNAVIVTNNISANSEFFRLKVQ